MQDSVQETAATVLSLGQLAWYVGLGSMIATFVAAVMADDQATRLKHGTFGTMAGSAIGGITAMMKNDPALLVVGFLGASVGALLAWFTFLVLSWTASRTGGRGRDMLEYYVGGFQGLRDRLDLDDQDRVLFALDEWRIRFAQMVRQQKDEALVIPKGENSDRFIALTIRGWMIHMVDVLTLVLKTLAKKEGYQPRMSIIVFRGVGDSAEGRHWLSYSGDLRRHKDRQFNKDSIGYKTLNDQIPDDIKDNYFTTPDAEKRGQKFGNQPYMGFFCFRINEYAVITIDWPKKLEKDPRENPFVAKCILLLRSDIIPSVEAILAHWSKPLSEEVALKGPVSPDPATKSKQ